MTAGEYLGLLGFFVVSEMCLLGLASNKAKKKLSEQPS